MEKSRLSKTSFNFKLFCSYLTGGGSVETELYAACLYVVAQKLLLLIVHLITF